MSKPSHSELGKILKALSQDTTVHRHGLGTVLTKEQNETAKAAWQEKAKEFHKFIENAETLTAIMVTADELAAQLSNELCSQGICVKFTAENFI